MTGEELAEIREWFKRTHAELEAWGPRCLGPELADLELNLERRHFTVAIAAFMGIELRRMGAPEVPASLFMPAACAAVTELLGADT